MDGSRNVCKELDDLSYRILELMDDQIQNNKVLEQTMKYGFIDIAKARYIMGNRNLSKLQLPGENSNEFTALNTVKMTPAADNEPAKFSLQTVKHSCPSKTKKSEDLNGVRKRISEETPDSDITVEEPIKVVDPLKWFGLLVPQNLRSAQGSFGSAIELVTQAANIQLELEATQQKYRELCLKKSCSKPEDVPSKPAPIAPKKKNKKNKTLSKPNISDIENSVPQGANSPTTNKN